MTIIINWFGPYDENDIKGLPQSDPGLHLIFGRRYADEFEKLYYAGICDVPTLRKRGSTVFYRKYYRGEIAYAPSELGNVGELVETILANLWKVHFTEKKDRFHIGNKLLSIAMHWYKTDRYPIQKKPAWLKELPTFFYWDGTGWQTGMFL